MIIYPAIDIKGGRCVRLTQGLIDQEKVYFEKPQEVAKLWQQIGAKILHVVDLDGAFQGRLQNMEAIQEIVKAVDIPVQVGGGIRSLKAMEGLLKLGVSRVILGTKALEDRGMLQDAIAAYGNELVVSIDAKKGYVAVEGWVKTSDISVMSFVKELQAMGVQRVVYTDISKDGMLQGPDFQGLGQIKKEASLEVIASGGISTIEDLLALKELGVEGAIIGKALYEGKINLAAAEEALR